MMLIPLQHKYPEIVPDVPSAEEALQAARAIRHRMYEAILLPILVGKAIADHDERSMLRSAAESLECARRLPRSPLVALNLLVLLSVAATCGDNDVAALFHGAVRNDLAVLKLTMAPQQIEAHDTTLERIRAALGPESFDAHATRGAILSRAAAIDEAITYVRQAAQRYPVADLSPTATVPGADPRLTDRQRQVLALLVAGLGNREIADQLFISTKTAMHHTTAIYRALGVRGRAETIAYAIRAGLST